ncbi:MAG: Uma2 family endonuclease [Cyanobacteria bacterium J06638_28]
MVAIPPRLDKATVEYPSSDGEPLAESYLHLWALVLTFEVLTRYLQGQPVMVMANQFLYYAEGFPRLRVAPDVMVIPGIEPHERDNYKVWEEGQVPAVIFEMTSAGTRKHHQEEKKTLYERLGVQEYWLFDPKGEWIKDQLLGYRLVGETYEQVLDSCSEVLQLRLAAEDARLRFYRQDNGERLALPNELDIALQLEIAARQREQQRAEIAEEEAEHARLRVAEAQQQAEQAIAEVAVLQAKLRSLGIDLDT